MASKPEGALWLGGKAFQVLRGSWCRNHFFHSDAHLAPGVPHRMTKACMDVADAGPVFENPLKADWRCIEVCHPVLGIFGASERYYGEFVATGANRVNVSELFGQIDPMKIREPELFDRRLRFFTRAVGRVGQAGEQQCVFGAETGGLRI